jgi:hypothetical protein
VVREARVDLLLAVGQGHPGLNAVHGAAELAQGLEALGMGDAAAGRHPVDLARADGEVGTDAVLVGDLALEQVGQGGQADVRVRAHVDIARKAGLELHRPHVVEEGEGAHHPPAVNGSTRPTSKPPRSLRRWSMTRSIMGRLRGGGALTVQGEAGGF